MVVNRGSLVYRICFAFYGSFDSYKAPPTFLAPGIRFGRKIVFHGPQGRRG